MPILGQIDWAYTFNGDLIFLWVALFVLYKILHIVLPVINDPIPWLLEGLGIEETQPHQERNDVTLNVDSQHFLVKIMFTLFCVVTCLQVLIVFSLGDMLRWNNIIHKIVEFHELQGNFSHPNISSDVLNFPHSHSTYFFYVFTINYFGAGLLVVVDRVYEQGHEFVLSKLIKSLLYAITGLAIYLWAKWFGVICDECTAGEFELMSLLGIKKKDFFIFVLGKILNYLLDILNATTNFPFKALNVTETI